MCLGACNRPAPATISRRPQTFRARPFITLRYKHKLVDNYEKVYESVGRIGGATVFLSTINKILWWCASKTLYSHGDGRREEGNGYAKKESFSVKTRDSRIWTGSSQWIWDDMRGGVWSEGKCRVDEWKGCRLLRLIKIDVCRLSISDKRELFCQNWFGCCPFDFMMALAKSRGNGIENLKVILAVWDGMILVLLCRFCYRDE